MDMPSDPCLEDAVYNGASSCVWQAAAWGCPLNQRRGCVVPDR